MYAPQNNANGRLLEFVHYIYAMLANHSLLKHLHISIVRIVSMPWRGRLVVTSPPTTKETGAIGRAI
jgi:hypothetical protein